MLLSKTVKDMLHRTTRSSVVASSWSRSFAMATRMKNAVEVKESEAATSPTTFSSSVNPSISTFFHDVDEIFGKNPFFSSLPRTHDFMSHFWRQIDWMDDMRRMRLLSNNYFPSYDIHSDKDKVQVVLDVPGVNLSDIDVSVENDKLLSITGSRKTKNKDNEASELNFHKKFDFGEDVIDTSKIIANLANGVLRVTLPKLPSVKAAPVNIKKVDVINGSDDLEC